MDTVAAPVVASCVGTDKYTAIKLRCAKRFSVKGSSQEVKKFKDSVTEPMHSLTALLSGQFKFDKIYS